jgi:TMEM175 potassium channel family protein
MSKNRMEAFSDGVVAILITIMVLDLKVPQGSSLADLVPLAGVFLSYVLSFALLGTYWNNHHHLLQAARVVDGRVLWANLALLFTLSLVPFATSWMGETDFEPVPTAAYGVVSLAAALTYYLLVHALIRTAGQAPTLARAVGSDRKGMVSPMLYAVAIPVALVVPALAVLLYATVVAIWIVPDLRIERALAE